MANASGAGASLAMMLSGRIERICVHAHHVCVCVYVREEADNIHTGSLFVPGLPSIKNGLFFVRFFFSAAAVVSFVRPACIYVRTAMVKSNNNKNTHATHFYSQHRKHFGSRSSSDNICGLLNQHTYIFAHKICTKNCYDMI